jgi:hypothetical protein
MKTWMALAEGLRNARNEADTWQRRARFAGDRPGFHDSLYRP